MNLVGNAIKFTAAGEVRLEVQIPELIAPEDPSQITLQFTVSDTGIGIPKEKLGAIFEAFSQADGSSTRKYGGMGLGLAISSRLVQMAGGKIGVESATGAGSRFHFTVPFGLLLREPELTLPDGARKWAGAHILLVEDNRINQKLVARLLEKKGYRVTVADNGVQALATLEHQQFELILMDVQMPEMGGFETTQRIREMERSSGSHIPIVAITANVMKGDRERCLKTGMDDYVPKPVMPAEMFRVMESLLAATQQDSKVGVS